MILDVPAPLGRNRWGRCLGPSRATLAKICFSLQVLSILFCLYSPWALYILENILGLEYHDYDIVHTQKGYADKFSISVTLDGVSCTLDVDIVSKEALNTNPSSAIFHPVSWGRTLCYGKDDGLSFRFSNKKLGCKIPTVEYVVNMLKSQKDIRNTSFNYKPPPGRWENVYENYVDSKFKSIEQDGYELD